MPVLQKYTGWVKSEYDYTNNVHKALLANKKLVYRRVMARRTILVEILSSAAAQPFVVICHPYART